MIFSRSSVAAAAAGVAAAVVLGVVPSAGATPQPDAAGSSWGTVIPTFDGLQSDAWLVRGRHLANVGDARQFGAADPATPHALGSVASTGDTATLNPGGVRLGTVSRGQTRAFRNFVPQSTMGKDKVPMSGVANGDAGAASLDLQVPLPDRAGGQDPQSLTVHMDASRVVAVARPGKPVVLDGQDAGGTVSHGNTTIAIPRDPAPNRVIRVPEDPSKPAVALVIINERVTTDTKGRPTLGPDQQFRCDANATSGYINAVRVEILGAHPSEVTSGHAAVIRDPKKTDRLPRPDAKSPDWLTGVLNRNPNPCS